MWWLLAFSVLGTSIISGIFGMAGGLILMAVMATLLSVGEAMALHGLIQMASNGNRAWFLRTYIRWNVVGPYVLGLLASMGVFGLFAFTPDLGLLYIVLGLIPVLGVWSPRIAKLDIEKRFHAFGCGVVVSAAQLTAGASGPLLDMFYVNSKLSRHEIVGTKALTQTLGHIGKVVYYGSFLWGGSLADWELGLALGFPVIAIVGTRLGKAVLDRLNDAHFKSVSRIIIAALGLVLAAKGCVILF